MKTKSTSQAAVGVRKSTLPSPDVPSPRYYRLWLDLVGRFQAGEFPIGSRMPTEAELCAEYGLGRITVRRALARLQADGVLQRMQGRGSVVLKLPQSSGGKAAISEHEEIAIFAPYREEAASASSDDWGSNILRVTTGLFATEGFRCTVLPLDVISPNDNGDTVRRLEAMLPRLAGVLGIGSPALDSLHDFFERQRIPWITINPSHRGQTHNFVTAHNHEGGRRIAALFARHGLRTAIFLGPSLNFYSVEEKFNGLLRGWTESGCSISDTRLLTSSGLTAAEPAELCALLEMVRQSPGPQGLFCAGDILASQAMRVFQENGLRVPEDVAVVGSTGLLLAEHTSPTLTVLAQPMEEMGREAETMLLEMIRSGTHRIPGRLIPSPLVFRESCPKESE